MNSREIVYHALNGEKTPRPACGPLAVLLQGSASEVSTAVRRLKTDVKESGCSQVVLSSGCTLAPSTPAENLLAFMQETRRW